MSPAVRPWCAGTRELDHRTQALGRRPEGPPRCPPPWPQARGGNDPHRPPPRPQGPTGPGCGRRAVLVLRLSQRIAQPDKAPRRLQPEQPRLSGVRQNQQTHRPRRGWANSPWLPPLCPVPVPRAAPAENQPGFPGLSPPGEAVTSLNQRSKRCRPCRLGDLPTP